jgi:hypothetical protein
LYNPATISVIRYHAISSYFTTYLLRLLKKEERGQPGGGLNDRYDSMRTSHQERSMVNILPGQVIDQCRNLLAIEGFMNETVDPQVHGFS